MIVVAARWLGAILAGFLLFPLLFVLWRGGGDLLAGWLMVVFIQFLGPYRLWLASLALGVALAIIGELVVAAQRRVRMRALEE